MTHSLARCSLVLAGAILCAVPRAAAHSETLVVRATRIYSAPDAAPLRNGVVVIGDGKIRTVGTDNTVRIPDDAVESSCSGGVITAGFHNSHVHFTGEQYANARERPAAELARALTEMLTRYGFTTVTDAASLLPDTLALRARIESGEVSGPRIFTAGLPLYPPDGVPFYLRETLPPALIEQLPQPRTPEAALDLVRANLGNGADATKLFIATPQRNQLVKRMPPEIALAATRESHARGKLVLTHPTDVEGLRAAVDAGVDIVVHTTLGTGAWPDDLMRQMVKKRVSLIPTLQLWPFELQRNQAPADQRQPLIDATLAQLKSFAAAGGQVLFGTDVGYMTDFDPSVEYELMSKAGLSTMQILAALTTAPSARWKESGRRGRIARGLDADLVVLDADPAADPRNFAKVRCTLRGGKLLFSK